MCDIHSGGFFMTSDCFCPSSHRLPFFNLASCYVFCIGIIMAHRDTLPSDPLFLLNYLSNFRMNQIATATSSRAISVQTTALFLSAILIALDTRTKSHPPSLCNSHLLDKILKPLSVTNNSDNKNLVLLH